MIEDIVTTNAPIASILSPCERLSLNKDEISILGRAHICERKYHREQIRPEDADDNAVIDSSTTLSDVTRELRRCSLLPSDRSSDTNLHKLYLAGSRS